MVSFNGVRAPSSRRLLDKEELRSFEGILDDRFQDNFRVRPEKLEDMADMGWADDPGWDLMRGA